VAKYGVLFETSRGPEVEYRPGTWEVDPRTGRVDRGELVPLASTRALRAREVARVRWNRRRAFFRHSLAAEA
jgi:hypothetical protein